MDRYTNLTNTILQQYLPVGAEEENEEIRSLDGFFSDEEAHIEDDEGLKKLGLTPDDINAVEVAKKLSTKAGGLGAAALTQNRMNAAYGQLMRKVAGKVSKVAKAIK